MSKGKVRDDMDDELKKPYRELKNIRPGEMAADKWLQDNATLYRGNNASDCMRAGFFAGLAKGREMERKEFEELERSYCRQLGEMARLSDIVCNWTLGKSGYGCCPDDVIQAANEIMEYVEAVRPPTP